MTRKTRIVMTLEVIESYPSSRPFRSAKPVITVDGETVSDTELKSRPGVASARNVIPFERIRRVS